MTDAITLIRRSARGDMAAHRDLTSMGIEAGAEAIRSGENAFLPYYEASLFARMAATSGLLGDQARLISVLAMCSHLARLQGSTDDAETFDAESLAIAELIADGDNAEASEYAAQMIVTHGEEFSADMVEMAKGFKQLWGSK